MKLRFDSFEVDAANGWLLKSGIRVPLREQAFQLLLALLERPGETVTRTELRQRLWNGTTTVDFEAGLNTFVSRLRDALNDRPESPRFIETVPKRGYRFIADVPKSPSLAVIPLQNATGHADEEYVADGLSEELIRIAARMEGMRVAARSAVSRFRGKQYDPVQVARELGVTYLVEGSVRRAGELVRIHLHVVNGRDGFELWSDRFDGTWPEILSLQDRVAEELASALQRRLLPQPPHTHPRSAPAYLSYLKGHHLVARHGLSKALEYFGEALRLDPEYALAYHGAAVAHILRTVTGQCPATEGMATAEDLLTCGLRIAPELCLMQNTLGMLRMFQWQWERAQAAYERAILLEPGNAYAHMMFALHCSFRADHKRALQHARQALLIEPVDPMTNFRLLQCLYYARNYDAAIDAGRTAVDLAPGLAPAYSYLGWALLEAGNVEEAWSMASRAIELEPQSPVCQGQVGYVAGRSGHLSEAKAVLAELQRRRGDCYCPAIPLAWVCLGLADTTGALTWLERAASEQEPYLASAAVFPAYDPLRSSAAFRSLLALTGHGKH